MWTAVLAILLIGLLSPAVFAASLTISVNLLIDNLPVKIRDRSQ